MSVSITLNASESIDPVINGLHSTLHETMIATVKAQIYHWNVTGMAFGPLHDLFQEIYTDHFEAQDRLAERIKSLGGHADGRMKAALASGRLNECDGNVDARKMVETLANDQQSLSVYLHELADLAEDNGDIVTNDLAIERADIHDKFAWMLNAHLR